MRVLLLALLFILAACTNGPVDQARVLCDAYAPTLNSLSAMAASGNLTRKDAEQIDFYRPIWRQSCEGGTPTDRAALEEAAWKLMTMEQRARNGR